MDLIIRLFLCHLFSMVLIWSQILKQNLHGHNMANWLAICKTNVQLSDYVVIIWEMQLPLISHIKTTLSM